ncbi:MAG: nitroreductase family protein [Clostridiales bacterium]|nr:nitroreductase family protein [Clostridiales bacterium]
MIRDLVIDSRSYRSFDESRRIGRADLVDLVDTVRLCPSAVNRQPLKYRPVYEPEEVEEVLSHTHWAGLLPDVKLPPDGHHPTAFLAICCDTSITKDPDGARVDCGIAAQTILLMATEQGMGGCMIGAFDKEAVAVSLRLPKKLEPMLLIALGIPDETVMICDLPKDGNTAYFRDKANLHFVPKRSLEEVIVE